MNFKETIFWISCFTLAVFYPFIKYNTFPLIENLFLNGNYDILNTFAFSKGQLTLAQYEGLIDQRLIGPISQIVSGALLVLIALRWFQNASAFKFFCLILGYFFLTKFEAFFFPCYGEVCALPIFEGIWLYENNFDYAGLIQQKPFGEGGPKAYIFSLYTTYIAFLYTIMPTVKSFLFSAHTINFISVSIVVTLFRSMAQTVLDAKNATLAAIVFLCMPLIQANAELINMEISVTIFAVLSAYYCVQRKFGWAFLFAILSVMTKGSGAAVCAAFFVFMCVVFLFDKDKRYQWRYILLGAAALMVAFVQVLLRRLVYPEAPNHSMFAPFVGIDAVQACKYLMIGQAFICLGLVVSLGVNILKRKTLSDFFSKHYTFIIMFVFALMWYALYINVSVMGPRYKVLVTPFMVFCVIYVFSLIIKSPRVLAGFLIIAVGLANFGSYGFYYPQKHQSSMYSFNWFERSLEYRNDMRMILRLRDALLTEYREFTVGAPFVLAQKFAVPELGYVKKPMDVVIYGMGSTHRNIRNFMGLRNLNIRKTVWVGVQSSFDDKIVFPIDPKDKIIKDVYFGDNKATLFAGGLAIEGIWRRTIQAYKKIKSN